MKQDSTNVRRRERYAQEKRSRPTFERTPAAEAALAAFLAAKPGRRLVPLAALFVSVTGNTRGEVFNHAIALECAGQVRSPVRAKVRAALDVAIVQETDPACRRGMCLLLRRCIELEANVTGRRVP